MTDVGLRTALRTRREQQALTAAISHAVDPSTIPLGSPWSSSDTLQRIVFEDIYGSEIPINTRSAAMRLPAIARGRNMIVSQIARMPLAAAAVAGQVATPQWMVNSIDGTTPQHRMAWTVDDLIFSGWSCWSRENYTPTQGGFPRATRRLNQDEWETNADNQLLINGNPAKPNEVILIPGFHEGILTFGVDTLRDARSLYGIVRQRLKTPIPAIDLHQEDGADLTETEIDALIDRWVQARNNPEKGGVGFTSKHIKVNEMGKDGDAQLMIDARNAAAVDLARLIGVHAGMLDATAPKASLNYETQTGRNQEFVDLDLALYMTPITARLSLDDVMPHGQHAYFDLTDYTAPAPSPSGPALED